MAFLGAVSVTWAQIKNNLIKISQTTFLTKFINALVVCLVAEVVVYFPLTSMIFNADFLSKLYSLCTTTLSLFAIVPNLSKFSKYPEEK